MAISIGQPAPSFSLYDSNKNMVTLADYKGKNVLLLFFPLAFTGVCTAELCGVRDNIAIYNEANAEVLGISVDSLYVLNQYKTDQQFNFSLLSDFNKETSKTYDVLYETFPSFGMQGVSKRAAFVIDKGGILQYAEVCASPANVPDFNAIQQTLAKIG